MHTKWALKNHTLTSQTTLDTKNLVLTTKGGYTWAVRMNKFLCDGFFHQLFDLGIEEQRWEFKRHCVPKIVFGGIKNLSFRMLCLSKITHKFYTALSKSIQKQSQVLAEYLSQERRERNYSKISFTSFLRFSSNFFRVSSSEIQE